MPIVYSIQYNGDAGNGLPIRVVAASFLVDFGGNGHGGVDRVGDDTEHGFWAVPSIEEECWSVCGKNGEEVTLTWYMLQLGLSLLRH